MTRWSEHPIVALMGVAASAIAIFAFLSGKDHLIDLIGGSEMPAVPAKIAWGDIGTKFSLANVNFRTDCNGLPPTETCLSFFIRSKRGEIPPFCRAHFYDKQGIEILPMAVVSFPYREVWKPRAGGEAQVRVPDNSRAIEGIRFECR